MLCFCPHNNEITCLLKMTLKSRILNFKKIMLKKGENMIRSKKTSAYQLAHINSSQASPRNMRSRSRQSSYLELEHFGMA